MTLVYTEVREEYRNIFNYMRILYRIKVADWDSRIWRIGIIELVGSLLIIKPKNVSIYPVSLLSTCCTLSYKGIFLLFVVQQTNAVCIKVIKTMRSIYFLALILHALKV